MQTLSIGVVLCIGAVIATVLCMGADIATVLCIGADIVTVYRFETPKGQRGGNMLPASHREYGAGAGTCARHQPE